MSDIDTYLDTLPEPRRGDMLWLHGLIQAEAPGLEPTLWDYGGPIIGYGTYHYKGKSSEGKWFLLGLASRKAYVSVYSMALAPDGKYFAESSAPRLGVKSGRSCLNIKKPRELDEALLREFLRESVRLMTEQALIS